VYDFLLVINSNLGCLAPLLKSGNLLAEGRLTGWKSQIFHTPSHLAPLLGVRWLFSNLWKSFMVP